MLDEPSNATDRGGSDVVAFDQTGACASLCLNRYRVTLTAIERLDLPAYLGSTLRGAFGHVFRRVACLSPQGGACPAPQSCPYHLVFEPVPSPDVPALSSFDDIPRPFVIGPPPTASGIRPAGSDLTFDLTLVGRARSFLPYFIVALRELRGIGRGRHPVALRRVEASRTARAGRTGAGTPRGRIVA